MQQYSKQLSQSAYHRGKPSGIHCLAFCEYVIPAELVSDSVIRVQSVSYVAWLYCLALSYTALMTLKDGSRKPEHYVTDIKFCMHWKTYV